MICCLLALLAMVPGVSLIRQMSTNSRRLAHCTHEGTYQPTRDVISRLAFVGIVIAAASAVLLVHIQCQDAASQPLGPICTTLGRVASVH